MTTASGPSAEQTQGFRSRLAQAAFRRGGGFPPILARIYASSTSNRKISVFLSRFNGLSGFGRSRLELAFFHNDID
jgi:hypothetical protein